jgi:hypothetical protein
MPGRLWSQNLCVVPLGGSGTTALSPSGLVAGSQIGSAAKLLRKTPTGLLASAGIGVQTPPGVTEPFYTAAAGQTLCIHDDFESYTNISQIYHANGGPYLRPPDTSLQSLSTTGTNKTNPATLTGHAWRVTWNADPNTGQQDSSISIGGGLGYTFFPQSGRFREIVQLWYRTQPGFQYGAGKKFVVWDNNFDPIGNAIARWTVYDTGWSILQTGNRGKLDPGGSGGDWDFVPYGYPTITQFRDTVITDGTWHRYTLARQAESNPGVSGDGTLDVWFDGLHVSHRTGLGTGDTTASVVFFGTFNGGNTIQEYDEIDEITAWYEPAS